MNTPPQVADLTQDKRESTQPTSGVTNNKVRNAIIATTAIGAAIAISAVTLKSCNDKQDTTKPATPTTSASTADTATPDSAPKTRRNGRGENLPDTEPVSFEDWRKRDSRNSNTLKSHNRGNIVDIGAFDSDGDVLHNFRIKSGQEEAIQRIKGKKGSCDEICVDMASGENKKAYHYEDPYCKTPTTTYGTVADDYRLVVTEKIDGKEVKIRAVDNITYTDLNGEDSLAPFERTKHVLGQVAPGKSCADLSRGFYTGRGNERIAGPTKAEFKDLSDRVEKVETTVEEHTDTLTDLMNAYKNAPKPACSPGEPDSEICKQARKAVRRNVATEARAKAEAKARAEKK